MPHPPPHFVLVCRCYSPVAVSGRFGALDINGPLLVGNAGSVDGARVGSGLRFGRIGRGPLSR
jgi:hypothetical protein